MLVLTVCFEIHALPFLLALYCEGLAPEIYLSQAPWPTDFKVVQPMGGTRSLLRCRRKDKVRAFILPSFQMTSEALSMFCVLFMVLAPS